MIDDHDIEEFDVEDDDEDGDGPLLYSESALEAASVRAYHAGEKSGQQSGCVVGFVLAFIAIYLGWCHP